MQPFRVPIDRVYVVGAYVPNGGTWMAYHLGRILHRDFGLPVTAVTVGDETPNHGMFRYDPVFPMISMAELENVVTAGDLLVCNPSFSKYQLGLKLPCRKLTYIQGFSTFSVLDRFFDHYVTVSDFVHDFIRQTYDLPTTIIPPFISVPGGAPAWRDRPAASLAVHLKGKTGDQPLMLDRLRKLVHYRAPEIAAAIDWEGGRLSAAGPRPHGELMADIGAARYLLTLATGEGFGLVPLEAMAQGTVVVGFDGFGGRHYMQPGVNCATSPYPDLDGVAEQLIAVMRDSDRAQAMSDAARATAAGYGYAQFRAAWIAELSHALNLTPLAVPA